MRALPLLLLLAACGATPKPAPHTSAWLTTVDATSPLVGKTWDARGRRFVPFEAAERTADRARFVLLGEKHDNPDHHRLQARALASIVAAGRRPAVVFEMIDVDLQPALDAYLASGGATLDGLAAVLEWDKRGWPPFRLYRPIFEVALSAKLPIVAGGLPHDVIRRLVHEGLSALPPEIAARVQVPPLPAALSSSLDEEIKASHCGMLPGAMIAPMSLAQRAKDAFMANLMVAHKDAVLVAGNGHARTDRGVPFELATLAPGADTVTISFVEVGTSNDAAAYAADEPATFLVFTPRVDDADPCAKFRASR